MSGWGRDDTTKTRAADALDPNITEIDRIVVSRVFDRCHRYIVKAVSGSSLSVEFLGALAANESGGNLEAAHFETWVYECLKAVVNGQSPAFGSIAQKQLSSALQEDVTLSTEPCHEPALAQELDAQMARPVNGPADRKLRELATSWGFTQIMGYHVIGRKVQIQALLDPPIHFQLAVELLTEFGRQYHLSLGSDFEPLFRCWNTGRPNRGTFNPDYVAAGMRRMALYRQIMMQAPDTPPLHSA